MRKLLKFCSIQWTGTEWSAHDADPDGEAETVAIRRVPIDGDKCEALLGLLNVVIAMGYVIERVYEAPR